MNQNLLLTIAFSTLFGITANAQVGIGTITPAATADITALNPTGAATNVDGILIPRVDRQRAQGMTAVTNSTLIYVNSIATGAAAGQAINITSTGFYYFDTTSSTWIKLQTGATDWSITGNAGTTAGTNFIGTTDAQDLRIKTGVGGVDRWNISNANSGQLQSYSLGTAALPNYSYQGDQNTGLFSPAADMLAVTTGGTERLRVNNNGGVGIGTTTPNGALDVNATASNYGFVAPRVALTASNAQAPVTNPQGGAIIAGTVVYNTATAGASPNNVSPGLYYWNGVRWVAFAGASGGLDWSLTGNSGTTVGTNFIGTTDAQDFRIKTGVGGVDRWNISNANNGQLQSYSLGTGALPAYSFQGDPNSGLFSPATDNISLTTNGVEKVRVQSNGSMTIGATYAAANAAPANGLRIEGQSVIGKASGEDSRDTFSTHTSATSFSNITGYPNVLAKRAIAGYADGGGMGVLGFSNSTGYGVVGLTQAGVISGFVQTGEGILGQADGAATGIPIGNHGIIDETVAGNWKATGILGENNNIVTGGGFQGGAYNGTSTGSVAGVYGNIGSRIAAAGTNSFMFGVIGDILTLGGGSISDGTGGVLGFGGAGNFGMLGYRGLSGITYSVYGGGSNGNIAAGNTGNKGEISDPNNHIGLGINGGFMGGYVKGDEFGMVTKGKEFGMYVQGNTIVNEPIVQLADNGTSKRIATYAATSTNVDISTRGVGALNQGEAFIPFKEAFKNLVSKNEAINVTVTPTSETNGVYVSKVTSDGFYIKENKGGTSNASFNWTAIGTRAGFEDGVVLSNTILDNSFDKNMDGVMNNDGTYKEGKSIYYDGQKVQFERIPENLMHYTAKQSPKKK